MVFDLDPEWGPDTGYAHPPDSHDLAIKSRTAQHAYRHGVGMSVARLSINRSGVFRNRNPCQDSRKDMSVPTI